MCSSLELGQAIRVTMVRGLDHEPHEYRIVRPGA